MSQTQATRTFINDVFDGKGFGPKFLNYLSDDMVWTATGTSPLSGVYHGKRAYQDDVFSKISSKLEKAPKPIIDRILVDQDWASVLFHTDGATAKNGMDFSMQYCWWIKVAGNKIVEVVGFYDQKKLIDLFA
jgi:hypothetical protein